MFIAESKPQERNSCVLVWEVCTIILYSFKVIKFSFDS